MPEKMTRERFMKVCDHIIEDGLSVQKSADKADVDASAFYRMMADDDELLQCYVRATEARSDIRFEKMHELMDEIKAGSVRPEVGRVLMDCIKWMAGREKPKKYGDNQQVTHSGNIQVEQLVIQRTPKTIEHQPEIRALPVIDQDVK